MKSLFSATLLFIFSCNSSQTKYNDVHKVSDTCFNYPRVIDSLDLETMYNVARWSIYTMQCDKSFLPKRDTNVSMTIGELALQFKYATRKHDTLEIGFNFIDNGEIVLPSMTTNNLQLTKGVGFNIITKRKIYMTFSGGMVTYTGGSNRFEDPFQPEVLNYIKNNWDRLNVCFRTLAEINGINK